MIGLLLGFVVNVWALTHTHTPTPTPAVPVSVVAPDPFRLLALCESSNNPTANTGNGFYGLLQFSFETWRGAVVRAGFPQWSDRLPSEAPEAVQDAAARQLQSERGWQPWPGCRAKLGLS
jgi:hypothetical protein